MNERMNVHSILSPLCMNTHTCTRCVHFPLETYSAMSLAAINSPVPARIRAQPAASSAATPAVGLNQDSGATLFREIVGKGRT